ncbi:hypothetical protein CAOG_08872 [Capsaspora owczarzaki ATCC 30864]|uniref:Uncharacterized protein n=1 Tax=Capsaspora owczarzaki (strain ATCC 30864) TaxID=595528 RepID=A0A0D2WT00_CAPO3|nr:hypothetical protein CAOG_08872 [Capsaspora owczarzaki ATCC 30864]KJE94648.1 hypothetical protein CAOG_008872 [Capsaspora owczarzaki ATCC 30864]|eukprot:XP_011270527.1 hypothetical protein CAOG_08872 [Capsaspora owczarzaki ATCC 30864]
MNVTHARRWVGFGVLASTAVCALLYLATAPPVPLSDQPLLPGPTAPFPVSFVLDQPSNVTGIGEVPGARYRALGSMQFSVNLIQAVTSQASGLDAGETTVDIDDVGDDKMVYFYMAGHIRTLFHTAPKLQAFFASAGVPYRVFQHTWSETDHHELTWWHHTGETPTSAPVAYNTTHPGPTETFLLNLQQPFVKNMVTMVEDDSVVTASGRMHVGRTIIEGINPRILASYYYTLQYTHSLAQEYIKLAAGRDMAPNAVIFRLRPDLSIFPTDMAKVRDMIHRDPNLFFGTCHGQSDSWREFRMSDLFFATSRQVMDKIVATNIVQWLEDNADNVEIQKVPERSFRLLLEQLGVKLMWIDSGITIWRSPSKSLELPCPAG